MSGKKFHKYELDVAEEFKLKVSHLRKMRAEKMQRGVHWQKQGRLIMYSDEGISFARNVEILDELTLISAIQTPENMAPDEQCFVDLDPVMAMIISVKCPNKRLVLGQIDGETVRIKIRHREKFLAQMKIPVIRVADGVYEYRGRTPTQAQRLKREITMKEVEDAEVRG